MTRLPQVERELVAAAARLHGGRQRGRLPARGGRPAFVAGLAALAVVALLTLVPSGSDEREAARPTNTPAVPAATLQLSRDLTQAPVALPSGRLEPAERRADRIAAGELPAAAAEVQRRTPYPPGRRDPYDWAKTPSDPASMSGIDSRNDLQALVEFRAACLWMQFWLDAHDAGAAGAAGSAAVVMADIPSWPTIRMSGVGESFRALATAARSGDADPIRADVRINCRSVGS